MKLFWLVALWALPALADECPDCTKLSLASKVTRRKPSIVFTELDPGKAGGGTVVLFDPKLPGIRKVVVDGKPSETLYQDADSNLYERFPYGTRKVLQLVKNGGGEGIRGEFRPLDSGTRRDLTTVLVKRFKDLPEAERPHAAYFILSGPVANPARYCDYLLKAAQAHGHAAALPPKCR